MKMLIAILGLTFAATSIHAQTSQDAQDSADTSAAQAVIQKAQGGTQATVLPVTVIQAKALQAAKAQTTQVTQDSADTSAFQAAFQKVKEAIKAVEAAKLDAATERYVKNVQHDNLLNAESKKDGEIVNEKAGELTNTLTDKAVDRPEAEGILGTLSAVTEEANVFLSVSTPSYTAGPSADQLPALSLLSPEEQQHVLNQPRQYSATRQQLQEALQQANDLVLQNAAKNPIPSPTQVQQSRSPQLKQGQGTVCGGGGCVH